MFTRTVTLIFVIAGSLALVAASCGKKNEAAKKNDTEQKVTDGMNTKVAPPAADVHKHKDGHAGKPHKPCGHHGKAAAEKAYPCGGPASAHTPCGRHKDGTPCAPKATKEAAPCPGHAKGAPCAGHGKTDPKDLYKYPSVFKSDPKPGTKASCPIKGDMFTITKATPRTTYKGKVYVFGCAGCKAIFDKDPAAALKKYKYVEAK